MKKSGVLEATPMLVQPRSPPLFVLRMYGARRASYKEVNKVNLAIVRSFFKEGSLVFSPIREMIQNSQYYSIFCIHKH